MPIMMSQVLKIVLRYYATYKVKRLESLLYKIFAKNYHLHWITGRDTIFFVLRGIIFGRYVQLKCSFFDEKNSSEI